MSARQIEVCAARLPEMDRAEFLRLLNAAGVLFGEAAKLSRKAWSIYRACTGLPKRGAK